MSKLNPNLKPESKVSDQQLAGGYGAHAAKQSPENQLRRAVLACLLWENLAYETGDTSNISALIPQVQPEIVAQIAEECRVIQKLRHVPLFIASEMLKYESHKPLVESLLPKIITRPDQLTDFLSIYWKDGKKPIAARAKKGLAEAFHNFDEYQFAKYDRDAAIKLRDVMFLVHPKAKNQQEYALFDRIAKRQLAVPDTWEVALSTGADKKQTWERLIQSNKIGGLAFLRNLRNMIQVNVDSNIIRYGFDNIKAQGILPLNFFSAKQHAVAYTRDIENMMLRTYGYLPKLPGKTLFIIDVSGSMNAKVSTKSDFSRLDVASAMAILAVNQSEWIDVWCTGGDHWDHKSTRIDNPAKGFNLAEQIRASRNITGQNGIFTRQCLEHIKANINYTPDRIVIFSDSQDVDHVSKRTPNPFGANNYIVDVSAHKNGINYKGAWTAEISGWSEHFLTYVAAYEGLINVFDDEE